MAFAAMLKQLREEKRLSQKDIADYLGITRQAVASYELAKREPDYEVLKKLADYFDVSIDYLLGRTNCRDATAAIIGKNIDLIRGNLTYKELSEDISAKLGALIFPEMLELYARGERMLFVGTIKILAKYAQVRDSFFYTHNTPETYEREKELYRLEMSQQKMAEEIEETKGLLDFTGDVELKKWILKESSLPYIKLAKEIQDAGLPVEVFKPLINSIKNSNSKEDNKSMEE
ncbi:DNA-binding XRE family transcriptional regulator [Acetivibrio thermocellus AD2]|uniref:DNA-binding XRE family transcriptional regulator n=1 Tax=Acetivibrio thermocellus AD2 TaxID=1138384 RepID=A0AB36THR5_ACETH|nr:helix-turn-helix transcriptional regulator [Acetivibrio thermocellus]ALX08868.1 helix-turn-helix domain protein [Acetivibrio thermocellus AD2]EIC05155.1 helix-turn-helix domain protein [Acetivibrio thermocellus YS]PFH03141.1 DNA-binding XRE family transcriptional regulator [Acetivibrio thermocellus AD2]